MCMGRTGTIIKINPANKKYNKNKYLVFFAGIALRQFA
jgi:hypothetical protein